MYEAIDFYLSFYAGVFYIKDHFATDNTDYFKDDGIFLELQFKNDPEESLRQYGFHLLQEVMLFHKDDTDKTAFIQADMHRLLKVFHHSTLKNKLELYADALKTMQM
ncbi:MAG: hypothetical protein MZV63_15265 [Marinilabiliales bacterium]|nr:hypothetical protein [Marinilabiliales bacterium]